MFLFKFFLPCVFFMTDVGNAKWERGGWGERMEERGGETEKEAIRQTGK